LERIVKNSSKRGIFTMRRLCLLLIVALVASLAGPAWAKRKVKDYSKTINEFKQSSDVRPFFDTAYAYAVFPKIGKGGLGVGAAHGKGQVYLNDEVIGFTALTDLSVGFQAGGQAYSQVIFFQDERALADFTSGNFEFDAEAGAIAIRSGASAKTGTEGSGAGASSGGSGGSFAGDYYKGMLVFTIAQGGLMYEATISGQKYSYNPVPE
jgi:lipid-binding SYLF domain-containing protein